jgi:hypothetical protein
MPDPLDVLPYEAWLGCILFAIDGREEGPRELLGVSRRWDQQLLDTPSFWRQIYVKNGENETARISTFLHFSKGCSLHVDILTTPLNLGGLKSITNHSSRVARISIRPGASDVITAFHMETWEKSASYILAMLGNGRLPPDVTCTSCFGISLRENNQLHYRTFLMQCTLANPVNHTDTQNHIPSAGFPDTACLQLWEKRVSRYAPNYS